MMEKIIIILLIALLNNANDVNTINDNTMAQQEECDHKEYINVVEAERKFCEIIENNPIDAAFEWNSDCTESMAESARCYCLLWENEIQNTLSILEKELDKEDFEALMEAHHNWENYVDSTFLFNQEMYYVGGIAGSGSMLYPEIFQTYANETKEHAIELMSYEYSLRGKVSFFYEGNAGEVEELNVDLNGDGKDDIIWLGSGKNTDGNKMIHAIFLCYGEEKVCIYQNMNEIASQYYFWSENNNIVYANPSGRTSYYESYRLNKVMDEQLEEVITIVAREDFAKEGVVFEKYTYDKDGNTIEEKITKEQFMECYEEIVGCEYDRLKEVAK